MIDSTANGDICCGLCAVYKSQQWHGFQPQFTIKSVHDFLNEAPVCLTVSMYVCPASVLQAMAVLVCAEMYQVKRLQHLCEVCVCAYLQSMPSRELASTGISVIRLLRRAKVGV